MKTDIQREITDQIVAMLESGDTNWINPLTMLGGSPENAATGKKYRGMNSFFLALLGKQYCATYKQWQSLDAQVIKGSKGVRIAVPMPLKDKETGEQTGLIFTSATVFSSDQVEGWEAPVVPDMVDETETIETVAQFVANTQATIVTNSTRPPCYIPSIDTVSMPTREQFSATDTSTATECFYSTLLHEMTHWTGHKSRNDRLKGSRFGSSEYAYEELIAEIGSAMLCVSLGVSPQARPDHAKYIGGWLKALKSDKKFIFKAASDAQKAVDYLESLQSESIKAAA